MLGLLIIAIYSVNFVIAATGSTSINPGHPLSEIWIDTDLDMQGKTISNVGGGFGGKTPFMITTELYNYLSCDTICSNAGGVCWGASYLATVTIPITCTQTPREAGYNIGARSNCFCYR